MLFCLDGPSCFSWFSMLVHLKFFSLPRQIWVLAVSNSFTILGIFRPRYLFQVKDGSHEEEA